jgi:hypothetical protein
MIIGGYVDHDLDGNDSPASTQYPILGRHAVFKEESDSELYLVSSIVFTTHSFLTIKYSP